MSVAIRLSLVGKKKQPFYRIIAIDESKKRNGKYLQVLGYYNPCLKTPAIKLDQAKYQQWLLKGAQPSTGLLNALKKCGNN